MFRGEKDEKGQGKLRRRGRREERESERGKVFFRREREVKEERERKTKRECVFVLLLMFLCVGRKRGTETQAQTVAEILFIYLFCCFFRDFILVNYLGVVYYIGMQISQYVLE